MWENQIANLGITLITGFIICLTALLMKKNPPRKINSFIGYRTKRSMKNQLLWDEANKYSSEMMLKYGIIFVVIGLLLSILFDGIIITFTIFGILISCIILMIIKVEKRLKNLDK